MSLRNRRGRSRSQVLRVESLEQRTLLAAVSWTGNGDGVNWTDVKNWSGNKLPTAADDVVIDVAANPTINIAGTQTIHSLSDSEDLRIGPGATLSLLQSSQIRGDVANDGKLVNQGNLVFEGTMSIGNTAGTTSGIVEFSAIQYAVVSGAGSFLFGGSSANSIQVAQGANVTFGPLLWVHGKNGTINTQGVTYVDYKLEADVAGGTIRIQGANLTNRSVLRAYSGATLVVDTAQWYSTGVIDATDNSTITLKGDWYHRNTGTITVWGNATLNLGGKFYQSDVQLSRFNGGGTVNVTGYIYDGLDLSSWTGDVFLAGGSIGGRLIQSAESKLIPTAGGGEIGGNITGDLDLSQIDGATVLFTTKTYVSGKILIGNTSGTTHGRLELGAQSNFVPVGLGGKTEVIFGGSAANTLVAKFAADLDQGVFIHGKNGSIIDSNLTEGITNLGKISADVPGGTIHFNGGWLGNIGIIDAAPGTIVFDNNVTVYGGGLFSISVGGSTAGVSFGQIIANTPIGSYGLSPKNVLVTTLTGNFIPANGQTFVVYKYLSPSLDAKYLDVGNGVHFVPTTGATALSLKAVTGGTNFASRIGTKLTVTGTANADSIVVSRYQSFLGVQVNGKLSVFRDADVATIQVNALGGDDTIDTHDGRAEKINGGSGNDSLRPDFSLDTMDNIETFVTGMITGTVFNDSNANGVLDNGEAGIACRVIYIDTNNNGTIDFGEMTTVTNSSGLYTFANLPEGQYLVREAAHDGSRMTAEPGYIMVVPGTNPGKNFGNTSKVKLSGRVFNDKNNDGKRTINEDPIAGVTVKLISGGVTIATLTSNEIGNWMADNISPGSGQIVVEAPAGYSVTGPAGGKYIGSASNGQIIANLNFGLHPNAPAPLLPAFAKTNLLIGFTPTWEDIL